LRWRSLDFSLRSPRAPNISQQLLDPALAHPPQPGDLSLLRGITGCIGIGVIAIAPGVAEESFFRGALQPRLGCAAGGPRVCRDSHPVRADHRHPAGVHAGCGLGLVRRQLNTTAAIVSHAVYNALAGIGNTRPAACPGPIAAETVVVGAAFALWYLGRRDLGLRSPKPLTSPVGRPREGR